MTYSPNYNNLHYTWSLMNQTWGQLHYINSTSITNTNSNNQFHIEIKVCEQSNHRRTERRKITSILEQLYLLLIKYDIHNILYFLDYL